MGVAVAGGGIEAHLLQRLDCAPVPFRTVEVLVVDEEPLGDDLAYCLSRRKRTIGVLEHELKMPP